MPSEREQRVRAAVSVFEESVCYAFVMARPESSRQDPMILREDAREYLVAIACEPEAAPDEAEVEVLPSPEQVCEEVLGHVDNGYCSRDAMAIQVVLRRVLDQRDELLRRAQPATANELAIRELEAAIDLCRKLYAAPGGHIADALCERLAALRQPAPAKEENQ